MFKTTQDMKQGYFMFFNYILLIKTLKVYHEIILLQYLPSST